MPKRNASGRFVKGGGGSRRSRSSHAAVRRGGRGGGKTFHLTNDAAAVLLAETLNLPSSDGESILKELQGQGYDTPTHRYGNFLQNARSILGPSGAGNAYWAPTRSAAYGSLAVFAGGKLLGWLVPALKRPMVRLGRGKHAIRVALVG